MAEMRELRRMEALGYERLSLYIGSVTSAIERYRYLPFILARNKDVLKLFEDGSKLDADQQVDIVNRNLERINFEADADALALFIMDRHGRIVASSNWREPRSLVNKSYPWSPFFKDAMSKGEGQFFADGSAYDEPGYFISRTIESNGEQVGVAVVKINLNALELDWLVGGELVAMSDHWGVVFLTSTPDLKYGTLMPLGEEATRQIKATKKYYGVTLYPPKWKKLSGAREEYSIVSMTRGDGDAGDRSTGKFMHQSLLLADYKWRLHFFSSLKPVTDRAVNVAIGVVVAALMLCLLVLYWRQRRITMANKLQAHDELERHVEERTYELVMSNKRLSHEIDVRQKTECDLREAQEELVQASKLAALGQMSAAIAHEINQPLTAIKTFVSSARLLIKNARYDELSENLTNISSMASRMANITGHLKNFARRSDDQNLTFGVKSAVVKSLELTSARRRQCGVKIKTHLRAQELMVRGDQIRLEQVLVNLINNAIDAMEASSRKELTLTLTKSRKMARLEISDSGSGIDQDNLPFLFDPFFTTKEIGSGLGLGLSISYAIVQRMGGNFRAKNKSAGGAAFEITLPLSENRKPGVRHVHDMEKDSV